MSNEGRLLWSPQLPVWVTRGTDDMRFSWVEPNSVNNLFPKGHTSDDSTLSFVEPVPNDSSSVFSVDKNSQVLGIMWEGRRSDDSLLRRIVPRSFWENIDLILLLFKIRGLHVVERNKSWEIAMMFLTDGQEPSIGCECHTCDLSHLFRLLDESHIIRLDVSNTDVSASRVDDVSRAWVNSWHEVDAVLNVLPLWREVGTKGVTRGVRRSAYRRSSLTRGFALNSSGVSTGIRSPSIN